MDAQLTAALLLLTVTLRNDETKLYVLMKKKNYPCKIHRHKLKGFKIDQTIN